MSGNLDELARINDGQLAAALAKAQGEFPAIPRDKEVTVTSKSGASYKFKYAPLDSILNAVRRPLADNGLALSQLLDGHDLVTMLLHDGGGSLVGRLPIAPVDGVQAFGSAITYLRRYSIQAILGIAAEEDDDGNHASGNTTKFSQPKATPEQAAQEQGRQIRAAAGVEDNVETEDLIGDFAATGMVRNGTAAGYKLEARQGPSGHVIGFRMEFRDEKTIPQVIVEGPAGEALYLATSQNPGALVDTRLHVDGRLFNVRKGKGSWKRLRVSKWSNADYSFPPREELPEPPADLPLAFEGAA